MRESDAEFGVAHDAMLANYHHSYETMWCENPTCANHQDGLTVLYESEYGQGWTTPEDCPLCHGHLNDEPGQYDPSDATDDDDSATGPSSDPQHP